MISSCFPHPENAALGVWAQLQAETLVAAGVALRIVSPTPLVPALLGRAGFASWAARSPLESTVAGIPVAFPRWPYYYAGPLRPVTRRWPALPFSLAWPLLEDPLLDLVRRFQPHVLFANHTLDGGEAARRLHQVTGLPFIVAEHDFGEITDCARFPARRRHYARVFEEASAVLAVSNRMRDDILALFPEAPIQVVRHGRPPIPDALLQRPRPAEIQDRTVIFSASGFFERKGIPLLIEAFGRIAPRHPRAELRIAGDGPERAAIEAARRRFDPTGQVRLLGRLPHDQILQEMAWADAFALTGWDEPFGIVFAEAFAAGLPVLCCNDGGICDLLQDGVHGFAVPPRDVVAAAGALEKLLSDPDLRARMTTAARALFESELSTTQYGRTLRLALESALIGQTVT
jgi:glycosyltransferase involved in cell wall biosynthesis